MQRSSLLILTLILVPGTAWGQGEPEYQGKTVKEWVKLLKHEDASERQNAAHALGQLSFRGKDGVPGLQETLRDSVALVRAEAADSLGRIGGAARPALPALLALLKKDEDDGVRAAAAYAAGSLGGQETIEPLIAALEDKNALVRIHAAQMLGRQGGSAKAAVPALRKALQDSHKDVQRNAREALKRIDPSAAK